MRRRFRIVKKKFYGGSSPEYIVEYRVMRCLWWKRFPFDTPGSAGDAPAFASAEEAERYLMHKFPQRRYVRRRVLKYVKI